MRHVAPFTASECRGDPPRAPVPSDGGSGEPARQRERVGAPRGVCGRRFAQEQSRVGPVPRRRCLRPRHAARVLRDRRARTDGGLDSRRRPRGARGRGRLLAIALGLGLVYVEVYGRGTVSVGAIGLLAIGIALGPGPAAYAAVLIAAAAWLRLGGRPQCAIFNAGALAIAAAAGAGLRARGRRRRQRPRAQRGEPRRRNRVLAPQHRPADTRDGVLGEPLAGRDLERALSLADSVLPRVRPARTRLGARSRNTWA